MYFVLERELLLQYNIIWFRKYCSTKYKIHGLKKNEIERIIVMLYRTIGKTGVQVSILGFGLMRLPVIDGNSTKIDEKKATEMVRYAIDRGVNYVDTAYPYHRDSMTKSGESEPFTARALRNGYREKVYLATKMPCWLVKKKEDLTRYLNEQLNRLETDHIDFYLLHNLNKGNWEAMKKVNVFEFLDKAIASGKIKYAGFSFHDEISLFKKIIDSYDWSFCQIQYNFLDENFQAGKEGLLYAAKKNLGIIVMEPLRGGKIVNLLPERALKIMKQGATKKSIVELALKWIWKHPEVSTVLSGMSEKQHVIDNINYAEQEEITHLSDFDISLIKEMKKVFRDRIKVNCTSCEYCMPCPAGVNIPKVFSYYNNYFLFDSDSHRKNVKSMYNSQLNDDEKASNCTDCGECEKKCPQNLSIRKELKKAKTLFEG